LLGSSSAGHRRVWLPLRALAAREAGRGLSHAADPPNARTIPAARAEIARSDEPTGVLARRYGISTETVRKWRKRGTQDCLDRSARPHRLP
jgi:hypothetical protein